MLVDATTTNVKDLIASQRVAVVANSPIILERQDGNEIDKHDVIIRINRSLPQDNVDKTASIGHPYIRLSA